jgi:hypothetical protein
LDDKDNPKLGAILQGSYKTTTKQDYSPFKASDGRDPFPGQIHGITSGYAKNLPQTVPKTKECPEMFVGTEYKTGFERKDFRSDSMQPAEKSNKELTGFIREMNHNPISMRPLEAYTSQSMTKYMYPTSTSIVQQDFYATRLPTGKEPLPSISDKANNSNGFTKGNRARADFATSPSKPEGFTTLGQIPRPVMNTVKKVDPAEAMNIEHPHGRVGVTRLTYKPPKEQEGVQETAAHRLGTVSTANKELTGFCENELPNVEHINPDRNPEKFVTQYSTKFGDPNPQGPARMGHTSGGVLPALTNGYTKSTQASKYGPIPAIRTE